jgi:cytochrome c-type biogenesis protein CcmH/NrfF
MKVTTRYFAFALMAAVGLTLVQFASVPLLAQQSDRAKRVGAKLMCMCGCGQVLIACNHINCPSSGPMLKELDQRVLRSDPDDLVIQSFVQEYGQQVLAEPPTRGFNSLAWFLPGIAFLAGLGLIGIVLNHWRHRAAAAPVRPQISPEHLARARDQADRDTDE